MIKDLGDGHILFKGDVNTISYRDGDPSWQVISLNGSGKKAVVKGYPPLDGAVITLKGHIITHVKYGEQVEVESLHLSKNALAVIRAFLLGAKIRFLSERIIDRLLNKWGGEVLSHLNLEDLITIKGLGHTKAEIIVEDWKQYKDDAHLYIEGAAMGLTPGIMGKAIEAFGPKAVEELKANPYELASLEKVSWHFVERFAQNLGWTDKANKLRVLMGTWLAIGKSLQQGDTFISIEKAERVSLPLLGISSENWKKAVFEGLQTGEFSDRLVYVTDFDGHELGLSTRSVFDAEESLGRYLAERIGKSVDFLADVNPAWLPDSLTENQRLAVIKAFRYPLTVISGPPGTGKTHVIRTIVEEAERRDIPIFLVSPTGKAAKRMQEVTLHEAETVHYLVGKMSRLKEESDLFSTSLYDNAIFVVDEASMMDIYIGSRFFELVPETSNVVLVGDPYQLPSVAPGQVLRDTIKALYVIEQSRYVKLDKVFRQGEGSSILVNAERLRNADKSNLYSFVFDDDFQRLPSKGHQEAVDKLVTMRMGGELDVVLTFFRKDREAINLACQALNPEEAIHFGKRTFKLNDPVIQTSNNRELNFFNGETGHVIMAFSTSTEMALVVRTYDGRTIELTSQEELNDLELAYAITVHKGQGSEYDKVGVFPRFHESKFVNDHFLRRSIFYTAITRAKKKVVIAYYQAKIGSHFFRTKAFIPRNTLLQQYIKDFV